MVELELELEQEPLYFPTLTCTCCIFLPQDLFLPSNVELDNNLAQTLRSSASATTNTCTSSRFGRPQEALLEIALAEDGLRDDNNVNAVMIVDTHGHAHLERSFHESYSMDVGDNEILSRVSIISLSCSVEPQDWQACLDYASTSKTIVAGLGVHPWYLEHLQDDYLDRLETLLQLHPSAIVGEIGLCKVAKFVRTYPAGKAAALELQKNVFINQMKLAAKYSRPVSVHCVGQHAALVKLLAEMVPNRLPPKIGMHSFTGTAHHVKQFLKFEAETDGNTKFYFGFSHIINVEMNSSSKSQQQHSIDAIHAVPHDRLMAESDVHSSRDVTVGTAGAIAYLASVLEKPIIEISLQTARNGIEFLCIRSSNPTQG